MILLIDRMVASVNRHLAQERYRELVHIGPDDARDGPGAEGPAAAPE